MRRIGVVILLALLAAACGSADESATPGASIPDEAVSEPESTTASDAPGPADDPDPTAPTEPTEEVTAARLSNSPLGLVSTAVGILIVSAEPFLFRPDGTGARVRFPPASSFYGVGQCVEDPAFECAVEVIAWDDAQNCLALDIPTGDLECWSADTLTDELPESTYTILSVCPGGSAEMVAPDFTCEPDLPVMFEGGPTFVSAGSGIVRHVRAGTAEACWQQADMDFGPGDLSYRGDDTDGVLTITGRNIFTDLTQTLTITFDAGAALAADRCRPDNPVTGTEVIDPTFVSDGRTWSWSSDFTIREPAQRGPLRVWRTLDDRTIEEFVIDADQPIWGTPVVTLDDDYVYVAIQRTRFLDADDQPSDDIFYEDGFLRFVPAGGSRLFRVPLEGGDSEELDIATQPVVLDNERIKFISAMAVDDRGLIVADLEAQTLYRFPPGTLVPVS